MTVYLGLGSNLDDRLANIQEALDHLGKSCGITITKASSVYETAPVGGPVQPDYLNAVIELETSLRAHDLLDICITTEKLMGRTKCERWGARNIDIDILLYGWEHIQTERLSVPHPRMHERGFVLRPLAEIAPNVVHPLEEKTIVELIRECDCTGIKKVENLFLKY